MFRMFRVGLILVACGAATLPTPASPVEALYSRWAFLALQRRLTAWSNAVPWAVTDVLLGGVLFAAVLVGVACARDWRQRGGWRACGRLVARVLPALAAAYLVFLGAWGLNYRREPLRTRLDFVRARATPASVLDLSGRTVSRLNALHAEIGARPLPAWEDLPAALGPAFARVQQQLAGVRPAVPGIPKRSLLTFYLDRAGVSGFTDPFALEIVVDRAQLPFERPFVAAHEWAHLAGYADESEANFVGWLTCLQGPPAAEYSGQIDLLLHLLGALAPDERDGILRALAPGPRDDLREIGKRAARVWPWLSRPAWWVYDRYLRANRVDQGVRSYAAALELLLGTRFAAGWVPVRRQP